MSFGFGPSEVVPLGVDFPGLDIGWMDEDDDESESGLIL